MLMSEFVEMTGFEPMADEYAEIEELYYNFSGNKAEFCADFVARNEERRICRDRAKKLLAAADREKKIREEYNSRIDEGNREILRLQRMLETELEWKPYEDPHNVAQHLYSTIRENSATREMTVDEAILLVADSFGFRQDRITILYDVPYQEINRHGRIRNMGVRQREPVYNASDWNYVRFNVRGSAGTMAYEMYNGELVPYWS